MSFDAVVEARDLEVRARIAAGLLQLGEHVLHGDRAEAVVGEGLGLQRADHVARPITRRSALVTLPRIRSTSG
jgi:hypothetical protein